MDSASIGTGSNLEFNVTNDSNIFCETLLLTIAVLINGSRVFGCDSKATFNLTSLLCSELVVFEERSDVLLLHATYTCDIIKINPINYFTTFILFII